MELNKSETHTGIPTTSRWYRSRKACWIGTFAVLAVVTLCVVILLYTAQVSKIPRSEVPIMTTTILTTTTRRPILILGAQYFPTTKPFPANWSQKPPFNLLTELGMNPTQIEIPCEQTSPPTFRMGITISDQYGLNHTWFADGKRKQFARSEAARNAVEGIFSVQYDTPPSHSGAEECIPLKFNATV